MGFIGKWYIFNATLQAGQLWLALALGVASIISIYYYLRVIGMMCFQEPDETGEQIHATGPYRRYPVACHYGWRVPDIRHRATVLKSVTGRRHQPAAPLRTRNERAFLCQRGSPALSRLLFGLWRVRINRKVKIVREESAL